MRRSAGTDRRAVALGFAIVAVVAAALPAPDARADDPAPPAPSAAPAACDAWEVEYSLNANVKITDTTMGGGDGTWPIGPGRAVIRFENKGGAPGGNAKLLEYRMPSKFTVKASLWLTSADVTAETVTQTTPNACGVAGEGTLTGRSLKWKGEWLGMHTDGTLTCAGGLCGKFGCPPAGQSPAHIPPHSAPFKPFEYAADLRTFTMDYAVVSKQKSPDQTSWVTLAGREVKRACVMPRPCP